MEYITVEQFRKQPVEVQKVFIDWWNPTIGDLFAWNYSDEKENDLHKIQCCTSESVVNLTKCNKGLKEGDRILLLTEGHLRQFIQDKMEGKVEFYPDLYRGEHYYTIMIRDSGCGGDDPSIEVNADDVLQAYWKVACLIAREEISNE